MPVKGGMQPQWIVRSNPSDLINPIKPFIHKLLFIFYMSVIGLSGLTLLNRFPALGLPAELARNIFVNVILFLKSLSINP